MENRLVSGFLDKVVREEVIPHLPAVPDTDPHAYFRLVARRLANPKIGDTSQRLCFDGSNRQPKFILPSIRDRLDAGGGVRGLALASALWCRYCYGTTEDGTFIEPNDPNWARLQATARAAKEHPAAWLAMADTYGDIGRSSAFQAAFTKELTSLWRRGTNATFATYLADDA